MFRLWKQEPLFEICDEYQNLKYQIQKYQKG